MAQVEQEQSRQRLVNLIGQWNQDHYDIFELTQPSEDLEFHGVVRFYFQDTEKNVVTKCVRVSSTAITTEVVDALLEKFRPDMRMLTRDKYALYEVHVNGEERQLLDKERPLIVQLNWGKDVREGRFLLKKEGLESEPPTMKRRLSKREKKEKKRQEKDRLRNKENTEEENDAEKLYKEMPETSFTRSISNPEAVMRRRRQQKLEKKLQQFRVQDGQGGTLKIYGETLRPDVPYKTLLVSTIDTVQYVIREAMEKYGLENEDPKEFHLVQVIVPPSDREYHGGTIGEERILELDECPLPIAMQHPPNKGMLMFQLKRRPPDYKKPKTKRQRAVSHDDLRYSNEHSPTPNCLPLPYLMELNQDGTERPNGRIHKLNLNMTEVGSEQSMSNSGQHIQLHGPNIHPRHCVIAHMDGIVTVTPKSRDAETYVDNQRVYETTMLQHGTVVRFGRQHAFGFIDSNKEENSGQMSNESSLERKVQPYNSRPQETNFDLDGTVETVEGQQSSEDRSMSNEELAKSNYAGQIQPYASLREPSKPEPQEPQEPTAEALPATLEFKDEGEDPFLDAVILSVNPSAIQFKLAPTYIVYLAVRFRLSHSYHPRMIPTDRAHSLMNLVNKVGNSVQTAIQENRDNPAALAFWMANASEILHFFKQDHDIHPFSLDAQEMLAEAVQMSFHHLVRCLQYDLQRTMPAFLDDSDAGDEDMNMTDQRARYNRGTPTLTDVLDTLSSAMNLLRRCRVNAALTIQLFSQLFHFVNMWLFNTLVTESRKQLCTRTWGLRLKRRLARIETWAEKQGLELAADCHLCRIIQAAHLLHAPKVSQDDVANISSTCFKLNSLQLRALLQCYMPEPNEPPIPVNLIDRIVNVAENMADELLRADGREIRLEEDQDLQLPFLLPEDGYSCDTIRGVPSGLGEVIDQLSRSGLCRMVLQPTSPGFWTVYMSDDEGRLAEQSVKKGGSDLRIPGMGGESKGQTSLPKEPEIMTVTFSKVKGSMGLSIVAAKGDGQKERGIYIKSVVPDGAAALDGRLQAGDQLLEVDGRSLIGLTQEKAAELMTCTDHSVTLRVAKQGAIYHGLATLLNQPSPVMPRASPRKPTSPTGPAQRMRPHEEGPPPYNGHPDERQYMQQRQDPRDMQRDPAYADRQKHTRSSPALNRDGTGPDQFKAKSMGNLQEPGSSMLYQQQARPQEMRDQQRPDPKSKSIPNLHVDTYDQDQHMRPAVSFGAIQHMGQGYGYNGQEERQPDPRETQARDYYNQGPRGQDPKELSPRINDYENHPVARPDTRNDKGQLDINQNVSPGIQYGKPQYPQHAIEKMPPSSRTSASSSRDERPQSAYFAMHERQDFVQGRPKSEEFNGNRVREWQEKYQNDDKRDSQSPHDSFENRSPNYSNILQQSGYVNQGDFPKVSVHNESRQPNFYENTMPRHQEPTPPFQQLRRPPSDSGKTQPPTAPKPSVAPKPYQQKVQPQEIPRVEIDNRQTQPHFYDPRAVENLSYPVGAQQNYIAQQKMQQDQQQRPGNNYDPRSVRNKYSPGEIYDPNNSPEFPPPPTDIPPELPPLPATNYVHEELPPLPPPPADNYSLEQLLREEQNNLMQQLDTNQSHQEVRTTGTAGHPQAPYHQQIRTQQQSGLANQQPDMNTKQMPEEQRILGYSTMQKEQDRRSIGQADQSKQRFSPSQDQYSTQNDYQNINSYADNLSQPPAVSQPPNAQNFYATYDPRLGGQVNDPRSHQQLQNQNRITAELQNIKSSTNVRQPVHQAVKEQTGQPSSSWGREDRDTHEKRQQKELSHLREQEINELSSRPYLMPQEEDRLKKLRLEHEFQRRVQEVTLRGDDDDSDNDLNEQDREHLIQGMQEDLVKGRLRLQELDQKHLLEEYDREKDRMERLERRIGRFEKEREEQRKWAQQQQDKKKEHEQHLLKQKELREKQRLEHAEQKRLQIQEEERMQQRKQEELQLRREMEKKKMEELQAQKEAEETLRAEAQRKDEEIIRQRIAQKERERRDQARTNSVNEERKRRESLQIVDQQYNYSQYANVPSRQQQQQHQLLDQGYVVSQEQLFAAPLPPERGSSFCVADQHPYRSSPGERIQDFQNDSAGGYRGMNSSSLRPGPEKKSVSFNAQLETQISPPYRLPGESLSSEQSLSPTANYNNYGHQDSDISAEKNYSIPKANNVPVNYLTSDTPGVIGAQEIYRDPRNRIEAKINTSKKAETEKMSFKEKMKYFAQEAGEGTPKEKPKASKSQRVIESQIYNGK